MKIRMFLIKIMRKVGFNIEINKIVGRFKLSQDKSSRDKGLAKQRLIFKNSI